MTKIVLLSVANDNSPSKRCGDFFKTNMIYDIEEGIFNREGIEALCTKRGFRILKTHFTESTDLSENNFFVWIQRIDPASGGQLDSIYDLEVDLCDDEGFEDEISISASVVGDLVTISVSY